MSKMSSLKFICKPNFAIPILEALEFLNCGLHSKIEMFVNIHNSLSLKLGKFSFFFKDDAVFEEKP